MCKGEGEEEMGLFSRAGKKMVNKTMNMSGQVQALLVQVLSSLITVMS